MPYNRHQLKRFARQMRNNPTDAEQALWQHIRKGQLDGHRFMRQHVIDNAIVDFACPTSKLAIELDGGQHDQNRHADALRTQRVNQSGYKVIRFWNNQVLTNTESVIHEIRQALSETNTTPYPIDTVPFAQPKQPNPKNPPKIPRIPIQTKQPHPHR